MKIDLLHNILISVLEIDKDVIAKENGKKAFISKASVNLVITNIVKKSFNDENLDELINLIYEDLLDQCIGKLYDLDFVRVKLSYDEHTFEKSIEIKILDDMKRLGAEDVIPIYEFCKMVIDTNEYIK